MLLAHIASQQEAESGFEPKPRGPALVSPRMARGSGDRKLNLGSGPN